MERSNKKLFGFEFAHILHYKESYFGFGKGTKPAILYADDLIKYILLKFLWSFNHKNITKKVAYETELLETIVTKFFRNRKK